MPLSMAVVNLLFLLACITGALAMTEENHVDRIYDMPRTVSIKSESSFQGGSIMTSGINVYLIFYGNSWSNASTQIQLITSFIESLYRSPSALSPNVQNWWSILTRYYDSSGNFVSNNISYADSYFFPSSNLSSSLTINSTSSAESIVNFVIQNGSFPEDNNGIYMILSGSDINVTYACFHCVFYGSFNSSIASEKLKYAWIPDGIVQCPYCFPFNATVGPPHGQGYRSADGTIYQLAYALPTVATNPFRDGWVNSAGNPLTASCANNFGTVFPVTETGGSFNVYGANNDTFLISQLYNLDSSACSLQISTSSPPPALSSPPPLAPFSSPPIPLSAPPWPYPPPPASNSSKLDSGTVIGISLGTVLAVILAAVITTMCCIAAKRRKQNGYQRHHNLETHLPIISGEVVDVGDGFIARRFTLEEVMAATDNFSGDKLLGEGGFGTVYMGSFQGGATLAVKRSQHRADALRTEYFVKEVRLIARASHHNLVGLKGFCDEDGEQILLYELVRNGSLKQHIQRDPKFGGQVLSLRQRLRIAMDAAQGLDYLHSIHGNPIIHRDVKSDNILLDENMHAKVADFGLLAALDPSATSLTMDVAGTYGYVDPEYGKSRRVTVKSDVYSFGVVLLELLTGRMATLDCSKTEEDGTQEKQSLNNWVRRKAKQGEVEKVLDPALGSAYHPETAGKLLNLAMQCTKSEGKLRPTMRQVLSQLEQIAAENDLLEGFVVSGSRSDGSGSIGSFGGRELLPLWSATISSNSGISQRQQYVAPVSQQPKAI